MMNLYALISSNTGVEFSVECVESVLNNSKGEKIMSNEDMKLAILHLWSALQNQAQLNKHLIEEIKKLEEKTSKKPFLRK